MKTQYQAILLGASLFSLGYAATHPDTLIIEESEQLAPEFSASLHPVQNPVSREENKLSNLLRRYDILSKERQLDQFRLPLGVYRFAMEEKLAVHLMTVVTEITNENGEFTVTAFGNSGQLRFTAPKILDTRSHTPKSFHVVCHVPVLPPLTALSETYGEPVSALATKPGVYLLSFPVAADGEIGAVRSRVHHCWGQVFPHLPLTMLAFAFDCYPAAIPECASTGLVTLPAARYHDPICAFQEGMQFSFPEKEDSDEHSSVN